MTMATTHHLSVFHSTPQGGNPTAIVLSADALTDAEMQSLARQSGHECGFVLAGRGASHLTMRYWVPNHEMEMCGHATVGAVWLMHRLGVLPKTDDGKLVISTKAGDFEARVEQLEDGSASVRVSQPAGSADALSRDGVLDIVSSLGITTADLHPTHAVQNGRTSRVKTLIPLRSKDVLDNLRPDFDQVRTVCESIGSTGLYPYVVLDERERLVEARQFPKSSGYDEDPATGIAAAALAYGLQSNGALSLARAPIRVRQGWAMGKPSEIAISLKEDGQGGCWISGNVRLVADPGYGV